MTAITSTAAGAWATGGTWGGGVAPGIGDTAIINHAVTVGSAVTVGTSGASGTTAITVNGTGGSLTVNTGFSLTTRGDVISNNATLTLAAGSTFTFDSSNATTPLSQKYRCLIGTGHNQASARLICSGSVGSRVTINSNAGGGNGSFNDGSGPWLNGGLWTATYTDFTRIGDATSGGSILFSANSGGVHSVTNCTFNSCGKIDSTYNNSSDASVTFQRCLFKNSVGYDTPNGVNCNLRINAASGGWASGTRLIDDCCFDYPVLLFTPDHYTITNNIFQAGWLVSDSAWALFDGNLDYKTSVVENNIAASISNCVHVIDTTTVNPHFIAFQNYARDMTIDGSIFEYTGTDANGDCVLTPSSNPASTRNHTIKNCIMLPNYASTRDNSGTGITFFGGQSNVNVSFHHNTYFIGTQGAAIQETGSGHANMLTRFKDNIAWDDSARGYVLFDSGSNDSMTDAVSSANADYNCGYNYLTGSNLKGYNNLEFSSGSPGANDINQNPAFTDATRNLKKWDTSLGGAGTVANALAELKKKNDPTASYNTAYTIAAYQSYIRAGFSPNLQLLHNAASDGTDIGAVAVIIALFPASSLPNLYLSFPAIPFDAKVRTTQAGVFTEDRPVGNLIYGERYQYASCTAGASGAITLDWDLGLGYTQAINHIIIANAAKLISQGANKVSLYSSSDASSYSLVWTDGLFDLATLRGPDTLDYIKTGLSLAGARAWRITIQGGAATARDVNKVYFGMEWNPGKDANFGLSIKQSEAGRVQTEDGGIRCIRLADGKYQVSINWLGVGDSAVQIFADHVMRYWQLHKFFLFTTGEHRILNNLRIMHVRCTAAPTVSRRMVYRAGVWTGYSQVSAEFMECKG